MTVQD